MKEIKINTITKGYLDKRIDNSNWESYNDLLRFKLNERKYTFTKGDSNAIFENNKKENIVIEKTLVTDLLLEALMNKVSLDVLIIRMIEF